MSTVQQLSAEIEALRRTLQQTRGLVLNTSPTINRAAGAVTKLLGGSQQRIDQDIVSVLQEAQQQLSRAAQHLAAAERATVGLQSSI